MLQTRTAVLAIRLMTFVTALAAAGALVSCTSSESARTEARRLATQTPTWAQSLREPVEAAPLPSTHDAWGYAPTALGQLQNAKIGVTARPKGEPRDLTSPLPSSPDRPTGDPVSKAAKRGSGETPRVVVNVHASGASEQGLSEQPRPEEASLAPLERLYRGGFERNASRALAQFGYDYFRGPVPAVASGPVPDDYRLGPGDEVLVTVSGSFDARYELEVDARGRVTLPDVGPVAAAGLRLDELPDALHHAIGRSRKGHRVSVSLGRLRTVRVHVVGEVRSPGVVEISARATILDALTAAGGPRKSGTLREVRRSSSEGRVHTIDLYGFLLGKSEKQLASIRDGDVIHVAPIGSTVAIAGYVQRPGIYEVTGPVSVAHALEMAGGLTPFTFTPRIQVERTVEGRSRQTLDLDLAEDADMAIADGELLLVGAVDDRLQPVVRIEGQVVRPGVHQYRSGMRVSDLLELADGLTVDAHLPQAFISRQVGEPGALEVVPGRVTVAGARRVLVIDLAKAMKGDPDHDVELLPLDQLSVRSSREAAGRPSVEILGAVRRPGTFELTADLRVSELIALAGNVTPDVYYDQAELIRKVLNEQTGRLDVRRYRFDLGLALRAGGEHDPMLSPGDRLVIRRLGVGEVRARIDGQVRFPGEYVFPAGARITDLIAAAGGVVGDADLRAATFTRDSVRRLQQERFRHLTEQTRRDFSDAVREMVQTGRPREGLSARFALEDVRGLLGRMERVQATGRIVIPFTDRDFPGSDADLHLEPGDSLTIPRRQQTISVLGSVFTPSSFVVTPGLTVQEALDRSGGPTHLADEDKVYVIRADGNVESLEQEGRRSLALGAELLPGDVVLVPRAAPQRTLGAQAADTLDMLRQAAEVALIAGQIGRPIDDFNFSSVVNGDRRTDGVSSYEQAILPSDSR